ncbi:MAG: DUF4105 domain-containing protein [Treponema sp.]|nr:DUF4105 domain-containing protein [Treponema sp.]
MNKKIIFLLLIFICISVVFTQNIFTEPGDNLTIKIAVIGPGDQLYFWWGHIALIIEDVDTGWNVFYDYGIFDFDDDNFFYNFAFGRLLYCCGASFAELQIEHYKRTNRDVIIYTLDLPALTKLKVKQFADVNILPENRDYFYHHFKDNCSTRIRDIIDLATDGQLKKQFENQISKFTLRDHVRRHTWFAPAEDWFLNFLMGQVIDTPLTLWDDMFLPSEVGKLINDFYYVDINGERRKLVSSAETISTAVDRPMVLEKPRAQWIYLLTFSLVLSVIFGFFFYLQMKKVKAGRILSGISMSICGLVFGLAGLVLYFMALFTNHDYTFQNSNMIFCSPLLLVSAVIGIMYAFTKNAKKLFKYDQLIRLVWVLCAAGIIISMVIKLLPWFYQKNLADQMLLLPVALVFALNPVGLKEVKEKYFPVKNQKKSDKKRKRRK